MKSIHDFLTRLRGGPWGRNAGALLGALALLWVVLILSYGLGYASIPGQGAPGSALSILLGLIVLIFPLLLLIGGALVLRTLGEMSLRLDRLEDAPAPLEVPGQCDAQEALTARVDALEQHREEVETAPVEGAAEPALPFDEDIEAPVEPKPEPEPAPQPTAPEPAPPPSLPFDTPQDHFDLSTDTLIRALQFPADEADQAGFAALKQAVQDHSMAKLLQSAEDVLNLLSQEGIYTDDLEAEPVSPDAWKAYAIGSRDGALSQLLVERDPTQHGLVLERTRSDIVFRDTALHFLRRFEAELGRLLRGATDAQASALMNTRTARAFILLGRVSGTLQPASRES